MRTDTRTAYEQPYASVAALAHEAETLDTAIHAAAMRGDTGAVSQCLARKHMLPTLLDTARRELAPLELAYLDAELEQARAIAAPLHAALDAAHADVRRANDGVLRAVDAAMAASDTVKELASRRRDVGRRVSVFAG
jgi:hypothetical protein